MSEATTNKKSPRLKKYYDDEVVPFLLKEFSLKNPMQVPRLEKITLNMGVGLRFTHWWLNRRCFTLSLY